MGTLGERDGPSVNLREAVMKPYTTHFVTLFDGTELPVLEPEQPLRKPYPTENDFPPPVEGPVSDVPLHLRRPEPLPIPTRRRRTL